METYEGVEVQLHVFLTSTLDVSGHFHSYITLLSGKEPPVPSVRRLGGPRRRSARDGNETKSFPLPGIEHQSFSP